MAPWGISLRDVLGFRASIAASAMRLNPMAADRAPTIATMIQNTVAKSSGFALWTRTIAERANGSAKIVCENLIMRE